MSTPTLAAPASEHSTTVNSIVFYFTFKHGDRYETHGFNVRNRAAVLQALNAADFRSMATLLADGVAGTLAREYGVHSWATRPSAEVDAIGFVSWEISPEKVPALLERWRAWFESHGATATSALLLDDDVAENGDDFGIYRHIEAKLLH